MSFDRPSSPLLGDQGRARRRHAGCIAGEFVVSAALDRRSRAAETGRVIKKLAVIHPNCRPGEGINSRRVAEELTIVNIEGGAAHRLGGVPANASTEDRVIQETEAVRTDENAVGVPLNIDVIRLQDCRLSPTVDVASMPVLVLLISVLRANTPAVVAVLMWMPVVP